MLLSAKTCMAPPPFVGKELSWVTLSSQDLRDVRL
jgi:hypothetical protein